MNETESSTQNIQLSALAVIWVFFLLGALFFAAGGHLPALHGQMRQNASSSQLQNVAFNLEHKLATAEKQQDKTFFQKTLDDRLVYVAYNGLVLNKTRLLKSMKYVDVNNYSMENLKVRELGPKAETGNLRSWHQRRHRGATAAGKAICEFRLDKKRPGMEAGVSSGHAGTSRLERQPNSEKDLVNDKRQEAPQPQ